MNNKGFTLIELLATITLLAVLMIIAVPNIIGVVNRNKNKSYIEDAKKLVSLAEYKIRSDSSLKPPTTEEYYCFTMNYLGGEEFGNAPNGGRYNEAKSYVRVNYKDNKLNYYVQLIEDKNSKEYGIKETSSSNLYGDNPALIVNPEGAGTCSGTQTY